MNLLRRFLEKRREQMLLQKRLELLEFENRKLRNLINFLTK